MYKERLTDSLLKKYLSVIGAVRVTGPRGCGKTTSALRLSRSALVLDGADLDCSLAMISPSDALKGAAPRLVDEWQLAPWIWDSARRAVDLRASPGQFIFTGSAVHDERAIFHSGTGRFAFIAMRTMSLFESGESTGSVSLRRLFEPSCEIEGQSSLSLEDSACLICRGGWPAALGKTGGALPESARGRLDAIVESEISKVDGVRRSPKTARLLLKSFARIMGAQATARAIAGGMAGDGISKATALSYLKALRNLFLIEDSPPAVPRLLTRTPVRTAGASYLADPSLGAAALGLGPSELLGDLRTMDRLFRCMAIRDLRVYAEAFNGRILHYRDKTNL